MNFSLIDQSKNNSAQQKKQPKLCMDYMCKLYISKYVEQKICVEYLYLFMSEHDSVATNLFPPFSYTLRNKQYIWNGRVYITDDVKPREWKQKLW